MGGRVFNRLLSLAVSAWAVGLAATVAQPPAEPDHQHLAPPQARLLVNPLDLTQGDLDAGRESYVRHCVRCHGADGRGAILDPPLPLAVPDLTAPVQRAHAEGEVYWVISHGSPRGVMPRFGDTLSDRARWQVVAYVRTLAGIRAAVSDRDAGGYVWDLPPGFPRPKVPADNPMTAEKVELGRHLFWDTRLSVNGTFACASCHEPRFAFADNKPRAVGVTGEIHPRSSMSLANVAYSPVLTWANPTLRRLETQALIPMFGEDPVELGLSGLEDELFRRLRAEPRYQRLFRQAFPDDDDPFTLRNLTHALASFQRTLISGRAPYDRYRLGLDPDAISDAAKRGEALFFSEELECFHCHGGFNFTETADYVGKGFVEIEFHNTGLYNIDGQGRYPAPNTGVHAVSGDPMDMGRFKAPTLRNIALTAPYMHDGSIATLDEVIAHYEAGGRTIREGPHAGVGAANPYKSNFVKGFTLTPDERRDLIEFLHALTDVEFTRDPRFQNPWPAAPASPRR